MIERVGSRIRHLAHGTLRPARGGSLAQRLGQLRLRLAGLVAEHEPQIVAVEEVFVHANPRSALVLGQARGVVLAVMGEAGLSVREVSAPSVKRAVVGTGRADKAQVQQMVKVLLSLERAPARDAADALALALEVGSAGPLAGLEPSSRRRRRRSLRSVAEARLR